VLSIGIMIPSRFQHCWAKLQPPRTWRDVPAGLVRLATGHQRLTQPICATYNTLDRTLSLVQSVVRERLQFSVKKLAGLYYRRSWVIYLIIARDFTYPPLSLYSVIMHQGSSFEPFGPLPLRSLRFC
jgi:hypothetical protein